MKREPTPLNGVHLDCICSYRKRQVEERDCCPPLLNRPFFKISSLFLEGALDLSRNSEELKVQYEFTS